LGIQDFATFPNENPRHDRYEGKPLYWVEEEIEVEYFKTLSRSRNEQSEYQVASTAESVFGEAAEPVRMDMGLAAGGLGGLGPPYQVGSYIYTI